MLKLGMSGAGALLWASLYLFLTPREFFSLLAAVLIHELGHILALLILDAGVDALCLTGTGLRIDCRFGLWGWGEILAALAGPLFGLLWCVCAWSLGFDLSCRLSAILTLGNLLPLSYLDGGRAFHGGTGLLFGAFWAEKLGHILDMGVCLCFCALGLYSAVHGLGAGIAITAAWLTLFTLLNKKTALI